MTLIAEEARSESLQGIGILATPGRGKAPLGAEEFAFEIAVPDLGMPAGLCAGRLACASRPMKLARLERHLRTPEMLSAVDGDAILCAAPPQEPRASGLAGLRALLVRKGQSVVLATGAWHWIPFPTGSANALFLVVFRAETGQDDLGFCDLPEACGISIPAGLAR
jgi:hypothetical protein